jgi:hypothetical protein
LDDFGCRKRPIADDVEIAISLIDEFSSFPFVDKASRANALGLFITPESEAIHPAIFQQRS